MTFQNHGGLANGGVCWWFSRFQRNALYLTIYKPNETKPTTDEARDIIAKIRSAKEVVTIPGYRNFASFADENQSLIQRELEKWQKGDATLRFAWVTGLSGNSTVESTKMKDLMDKIYQEVEVNKNIAYNKLQIPGIDSHAWLVVHMKKVNSGYDLEILDSNFPRSTELYQYREGDKTIDYHGYFHFTPYLERTDEMKKINDTILKKCDPEAYEAQKKKEEAERKAKENNNSDDSN